MIINLDRWIRRSTLVKPIGEGRYVFYPFGKFGAGYLLEEAQQEQVLNRHVGLQKHGLIAFAMVWLVSRLVFEGAAEALVPLLSFLLIFALVVILSRRRFADLPKSAIRPTAEDMRRHQINATSTAHIAVFFVLTPIILFALAWMVLKGLQRGEPLIAAMSALLLIGLVALAVFVGRIARRKWAARRHGS